MSKPHVCFVSDTLHTYFKSGRKKGVGGAERQQYFIANELQKLGFPVSVLTLKFDESSPETIDSIEVWKEIPDVRGVTGAPIKAARILRYLQKIDADVYYVRGNDFLCMITGLYCSLTDAKFVYAVANDSNIEPEFLRKRNLFVRKWYLSSIASADLVTVLTPHQKKILSTHHEITSTVIPCGYDLPSDDELLQHEDRQYVLWVGRLNHDQKKPERFLQVAGDNPQIPFVMIGPPDNDDENLEYFQSIKEKAGELENLEFIEFVPPDEIHEYFRKASLLVNTSDYEGFGNVFLEAWRYATPVVTLHYTLHGVINDNSAGEKAESIEDLSSIVSKLHQNPELRDSMGKAGRDLVRNKYSLNKVAKDYQKIFTSI